MTSKNDKRQFHLVVHVHNLKDFRGTEQLGIEAITPRDFLRLITESPDAVSKLTVEFPESLRRIIEKFAAEEGYTVDQFLASAAGEKMAAMRTVDYLRREVAGGSREDFERFLAAVPPGPPVETDLLPEPQ